MHLAMVFPIQWNEPFGLVMIEAMACGTPVLALPGGSYAAFELHRLILAPPRTDKTGMLADWIIRHPGPALTTSTRADLHQLTSPSRRGRGPVYVFNPEGVGDVPSTFAWDLLGVCTDELMAHKMADWLAGDTPGYGDLSWFEEQGTMGMSGLLLAAAKTGATLAEVYQWVQRRGHEVALAALAGHGNPQLHAVGPLADGGQPDRRVGPVDHRPRAEVGGHPAAGRGRRPGRGTFNAREFALYGGTLHLIASGDSRSVITPLLRALASYVHYEAGLAGSRTAAGRLDPPLLMAMDEVAQVCPVDLPSMLADSAGKGIVFVTVGHTPGQARGAVRQGRRGEHLGYLRREDAAAGHHRAADPGGRLAGLRHARRRGRRPGPHRAAGRAAPPAEACGARDQHGLEPGCRPGLPGLEAAECASARRRPVLLPLQRTGEAAVPELTEVPADGEAAPIPSVNGSGWLAGAGDERR